MPCFPSKVATLAVCGTLLFASVGIAAEGQDRVTLHRELVLTRHYLNLPVRNGAEKRRLEVVVDGKAVREFEIELAGEAPDWWAFLDTSSFSNKTAILKIQDGPASFRGLDLIEQSDSIKGAENLYQERLRPQFHFTSRRGWNNDPNGLVFYKGEYHLFYQLNPYGWNWGNMHWGHAVSDDVVHWRELPIALYPDEHGTMFSGSAVVDWSNTAGFQTGKEKPLVCIFTAAGKPFTQGLAYSNDRGRTWTKYEGNPVVPHIVAENRDPKVFWYAPEKKWVMALYLDQDKYAILSSKDLKSWTRLSEVKIPGTWECPELFQIAVDGRRRDTRWVFYGGNGRYLVGRFDGRQFTTESGPETLNRGNCFYASQTYNDIPKSDGRRILVPWGQVAMPGMPFNQMIGMPVELTLRTTTQGLRLYANPIRELTRLRTDRKVWKGCALSPGKNPLADVKGELFEVAASLEPGSAREVGFTARGIPIRYNVARQELTCGEKTASLPVENGRIRLRFFVDRTSIDIFGNDGAVYMPMGMIVPPENHSLGVHAQGGEAKVVSLEVHHLKSAWGK